MNTTALRSRYHAVNDKDVLPETDGAFTQGGCAVNMLPLLGSNHRMRGYYEGRYRDKNAISGQLEYRHKLSWRHGVVGCGRGHHGDNVFCTIRDDGRWLPSAAWLSLEFAARQRAAGITAWAKAQRFLVFR